MLHLEFEFHESVVLKGAFQRRAECVALRSCIKCIGRRVNHSSSIIVPCGNIAKRSFCKMTNHLVHSPFKASINRLLVFAFPPFLAIALFFVFFHAQTNHSAASHGNYGLHQALTMPSLLLTRDDYTCDVGKPCSNGACW